MFITFEGPEGSGKSTQILLLAESLRAMNCEVLTTREPGGIPGAEGIRELVLHADFTPRAEVLLFLAARAEHLEKKIIPALEQGQIVLCDRFSDSTLAYQGYGLRLDIERVRSLDAFATGGRKPDLTLLLDLDPAIGLRRRFPGAAAPAQLRLELQLTQAGDEAVRPVDSINRMENRDPAFHQRVRQGFLREAERDPTRVIRIDAGRPIEVVSALVLREVQARLQARETMP